MRDTLNNYKSRWVMSHAQTLPNDGPKQTAHPGCAAAGVTGNACPGNDWGWFDVGHVRFISRPEPEPKAYTDWQTKADAIMASAEANPNIWLDRHLRAPHGLLEPEGERRVGQRSQRRARGGRARRQVQPGGAP